MDEIFLALHQTRFEKRSLKVLGSTHPKSKQIETNNIALNRTEIIKRMSTIISICSDIIIKQAHVFWFRCHEKGNPY